jgi:autotransporter-associated beta strand protein
MPAQFTATITNSANVITVDYLYHPIRGANFGVYIQDASSNFVAYASPLPPAGTYLGTVRGYPGATACALLQTNGTLWEYVIFEAGDQWWADNGAVTGTRGSATFTPSWPTSAIVSPSQAAAVTNVVAGDIIADIPYNNFTSTHGSSVEHVLYATEFCLMETDLVYLRDIGFLHRLSRVFIRGAQASDPYQSGNALATLRGQFTFVGHECLKFVAIPGYGGGVALVGTVGDNYSGASVDDTDGRGDAYIYWRHEVGHNHGSGDGQGGYCENDTLLNANQVGRMSGPEEAKMLPSRHGGPVYGSDVMENLGPYSFPIPPRASLDTAYAQPTVPVIIDVMANDHDVNNNALTLLSFDTNSAHGGTITRSVGTGPGGRDQLIFTGANDFVAGLDNFQYRLQDSAGMQALGNVYVQVGLPTGDELAYWPLDDAAGTNAQEVVGGATATATNGVAWTTGRYHGAAQFNGVNQYFEAPLSVSETSYAASLWFRTSQASGGLYMVTATSGGWDRSLSLSGGNIVAYIYNSETVSSTGLNLANGQWHHLVHTFGGTVGGQKVYVDGVLVASGAKNQSQFNSDNRVRFGHNNAAGYFNGTMDDVRLFQRALSSDEVMALYQGGGPAEQPFPPASSLISGGNSVDLSWLAPGAPAVQNLYLGTNFASVRDATPASPEFLGTLTATNYTLATVPNIYYWRVDERASNDVSLASAPWFFTYVDDPDSYTFNGLLNGSGVVIQNGPGNLILSGSGITHAGPTRLVNGTLTLSAASGFNSPITIGANSTLVLDGTGSTYNNLPQPVSGGGAAPVTVNGNGTQWSYLSADNTYTNGTRINSGGMLSLGNNTAGGTVLGAITNYGTLGINRTAGSVFTNGIVGSGSINLYNGNVLSIPSLSQSFLNGYSGTLSNTTVQLSGGLKFGNGTGGGGLTIPDGASVTVTAGGDNALRALQNSYNNQALNITGGTLTALNGYLQDDWDTAYAVTQSGGVVNIAGMRSSGYWGGWGRNNTYTLTGGTLILGASGIVQDYYGLIAYLGGGTLSASADTALSANVQFTGAGGDLTVDTAGHSISFNSGVSGAGGVIKTGPGTMTLSSASTYAGATTANGGRLEVSTAQSLTGPLTVNPGGTLAVTVSNSSQLFPVTFMGGAGSNATNEFSGLSSTSLPPIQAGTLSVNGTLVITIASGTLAIGQDYPLIGFSALTGTGGFRVGRMPAGLGGVIVTNGNVIALSVTPLPVFVWNGAINGTWDIGNTPNWTAGGPIAYSDGAIAQFDDSASGTTTVTNTVTVSPSTVVVSNNIKAYSIGGSPIAGAGTLTKSGTGNLTLLGVNMFTGTIAINAGTLAISGAGQLGGGSYAAAITNNGALNFNSSAAQTLSGALTGGGSLTKAGSNTLNLNGANAYTGPTTIASGTLAIAGAGGTYAAITNSATLLVSSSADQTFNGVISGSGTVNLTGNSYRYLGAANTFTGPLNILAGTVRENTHPTLSTSTAVTVSNAALEVRYGSYAVNWLNVGSLTLAGGATLRAAPQYQPDNGDIGFQDSLTVLGTNTVSATGGSYRKHNWLAGGMTGATNAQMNLSNGSGYGAAGHAIILSGGVWSSFLGTVYTANDVTIDANIDLRNAHVVNAGTFGFYNNNFVAEFGELSGGGALVANGMTNGEWRIGNLGTSTTYSGVVDGASKLTKVGAGSLTLTANHSYSGATTISNGTLAVNGSLAAGSPVTVVGGSLGGTGTVGGPVSILAGGTLAPGSGGIGTLTLTNSPVLGGRVLMEINKSALPNADKLAVSGQPLAFGGTLTVTNIGTSPLAAGDTFTLFTAASFSGNFTGTNLPALPPGLGWVWAPTNGTLSVVATVNTTPTRLAAVVSAGQLTLSWPTDHTGWKLQAQTNALATGLTFTWNDVPGSTSTNLMTFPINPAAPTVFYRMKYP